jgi:transglutaminase-like putative cysteine protease
MKPSVFLHPVVYGMLCLLLTTSLHAQQPDSSAQAHPRDSVQFQLRPTDRPDMDFGTVTPETFTPTVYSIDSSADAIVLFDHGEVTFDPTGYDRRFSYILERHVMTRLLHKSAINSLASLTLAMPRGGDVPYIEKFKGATYNLEDGKLVVTKLDKSSIFKDEGKNFMQEKVAFPNLKEGSIIEYSYRIIYPGPFIPPWTFQGHYPELWSEYDITVPTLYDYAVKHQGYQKYVIDSSIYSTATFPVSLGAFMGTWSGQTIRRIWALQDVPALERSEPYTTSLKNHLSKIEFQLSAVHTSGYSKTYRTTWNELVDELMKRDNFGAPLTDHNRWVDDELKSITAGAATPTEAARRIYAYVRDHFDCSTTEGMYMTQPLKKVWEDKKGNVADINLLLTALLRHAGLEASPVILSSRSNGVAVEDYPLLSDYNYVITRVFADGDVYLLDASKPFLGFGQLPDLCYNGWARSIDNRQDRIPLLSDSITEKRVTLVFLSNTDSGYTGTYTRHAGIFESMEIRNRMRREKPEDFFENMQKGLASDKQMEDYGFDSLAFPDQPVTWHYDMRYNFTKKTIYFNPIFHERFNNNPFNSPVRHYPVEMPYCIDNSYNMTMDIPKGYKVDQLPKSQRVVLEDGAGIFEYLIQSDGKTVEFRTHLQIKKTWFALDEYPGLRDFFSAIVNKEKEPVVLKKID